MPIQHRQTPGTARASKPWTALALTAALLAATAPAAPADSTPLPNFWIANGQVSAAARDGNTHYLAAGAHRFSWNGNDRGGRPVPAGIYLVRLITGRGEATKRVAWIANR